MSAKSAGTGSKSKTGSKQSGKKTEKLSRSKKTKSTQNRASVSNHRAADEERQPLLEPQVRLELIGVILVVLSIALLFAVAMPGEGWFALAISFVCRSLFGIGALALPFLIAAWGASFFLRQQLQSSRLRLTIGISVIFVAVLTLLALNTVGAETDTARLFVREALETHGGYLGALVAWLLLSSLGYAIGMVIGIGSCLAGAVLIGFSLVSTFERIKNLFTRDREDDTVGSAYDMGEYDSAELRAAPRAGNGLISATARFDGKSASPAGFAWPDEMDDRFDEAAGRAGQTPDSSGETPDNTDSDSQFADELSEQSLPGVTRRLPGRLRNLLINDSADSVDGSGEAADGSGAPTDGSPASGTDFVTATGISLPIVALQTGDSADPTASVDIPPVAVDLEEIAEVIRSSLSPENSYQLPGMSLLKTSRARTASKAAESELRAVAAELQETLQQFQVDAQVVGWTAGPTVTLYKLALGEGVRVARITSLADDIALALAATSVRIFSPIPGTSLVGVEVPNAERSLVLLGDVLPSAPDGALQMAIGKDVEGTNIVANLAGMPHLLIGGTTGSGKSVSINAMIMSLLMRSTPDQVRMILIDPKMVELTRYNDIPHLYVPVVTDSGKAAAALAWGVIEMERRLKLFMEAGVKNVASYNEHVGKLREQAIRDATKAAQAAALKAAQAAGAADAADVADVADAAGAGVVARAADAVSMVPTSVNGEKDELYADWPDALSFDEAAEAATDWLFDDDDDYDLDEIEEPANRYLNEFADPEIHQPIDAARPDAARPDAARPDATRPDAAPNPAAFEIDAFIPDDVPEELPLIVIVIDELADLMIVAGKDVESSVTRLSQLARAAGLHLVIATQRPSTNVITGVIKANIVNRIAFNVGSGIDSRVILDTTGAEALLGNGDLLFSRPESGKPTRIQGCYVSESEITAVVDFWHRQGSPDYHEDILATAVGGMSTYQSGGFYDGADSDDPLVWEAADIVVTTQMGSTSTLQRRLKVGYARAGRIMDNLEQKGIVGPANGSKPREVIVSDILELESLRALEAADRY